MAIIQGGSSTSNTQNVDAGYAGLVTARPVAHGSLGHYRISQTSGTIAAALAAGTASAGHLFAFRWTHATNVAVITKIKLRFQPLTAFTAGSLTDFGFDAFRATNYSASHSGGTAITPASVTKMRSTMGNSDTTDIRIASTGALTNGTNTLDAFAFCSSVGDQQRVNPAAATEEQLVHSPDMDFKVDIAHGEHPLVLGQNEGFVIRNRAVWPAAGTGIIQIEVVWSEVPSY